MVAPVARKGASNLRKQVRRGRKQADSNTGGDAPTNMQLRFAFVELERSGTWPEPVR